MTLSPRDDEPDDHASRAEASDTPSEPVDAPAGTPPAPTGDGTASPGQDAHDEDGPADRAADRAAAEAAAWEAIVANYGEAPAWEDRPDPTAGPSRGRAAPERGTPHPDHPAGRGRRRPEPPSGPDPSDPSYAGHRGPQPDPQPDPDPVPDVVRGPDERFVPPPAPPLPRTSPARALAWFGLLGVPSVVLVLLVAGVSFPGWIALGFTAWFVGGFGFLVAGMRRGPRPDDGPDDGAVV